jgi:glycosyltransferase 2 family protein
VAQDQFPRSRQPRAGGVLASQLRWSDILHFFQSADPLLIVVLLLFFPLDRAFMAWKWRLLLLAQGEHMRLWTAVRIYLGSTVAGLAVPLGGAGPDIVRVAMLRTEGVPGHLSVGSIIIERLAGLVGSVLMLGTAAAIALALLGPAWLAGFEVGTELLLPIGVAMIAWAVAIGWSGPALFRRLAASRLGQRLDLPAYIGTLTSLVSKRALMTLSVVLAWIEQWASVIAFYLTCQAFGVELGFLACAAIVPLASILERLPISIGGLGLREAGIVLMALPFGISATDAFLVSITNYSLYLLSVIPLSALFFVGQGGTAAVQAETE